LKVGRGGSYMNESPSIRRKPFMSSLAFTEIAAWGLIAATCGYAALHTLLRSQPVAGGGGGAAALAKSALLGLAIG
jgi:hypothetical protein